LLELPDALLQVRELSVEAFHVVGIEALVFGLIQGDLAHEFAQIDEALFHPSETRVGLVESLIEVLP